MCSVFVDGDFCVVVTLDLVSDFCTDVFDVFQQLYIRQFHDHAQ